MTEGDTSLQHQACRNNIGEVKKPAQSMLQKESWQPNQAGGPGETREEEAGGHRGGRGEVGFVVVVGSA